MKLTAPIITFVTGTVVVTLVGSRTAKERRLARLRAAQERWAETMDRR